jgi:serine/threonine protein kinase
MFLTAGRKLGRYEILSLIGVGGMGEVYRARDTRLDRTVAIKVLPEHLSNKSQQRDRFEREGKAVSTLNHPHICALYDVGCEDGVDYLVMEFLEGETLAHRLKRGPLPLDLVFRYSIEIADALDQAHRKRVIHRDLKPSNIVLTNIGAKVLDFGLASVRAADVPTDVTASTSTLTEKGAILGTPQYMAPEQLKGKRADARSDIFAFGAVVYEMATGRKAFEGQSKASLIVSILEHSPPPLLSFRPTAPAALGHVVQGCIAKDPEERWQSAGDLKRELKWISDSALQVAVSNAPSHLLRNTILLIILILVSAGAALYPIWRLPRQKPTSFERLTFRRGEISGARFGPDGHSIYYSAAWDNDLSDVFFAIPGNPEGRPLRWPGARLLSISRSGEAAILVGEPQTTLARAQIGGGQPRNVLDNVLDADWSPDGSSLAVARSRQGKNAIEYPIGTTIFECPPNERVPAIRVSPSGKVIAFVLTKVGTLSIMTIDTRDRVVHRLSDGWLGVGYLAWSRKNEVLFSAMADDRVLSIYAASTNTGAHRRISQSPGSFIYDVAPDGRMLLGEVSSRGVIRYHKRGKATEDDLSWLDASLAFDLSRDGRLLLFVEPLHALNGESAIYIRRTDGSPAIRVAYGNRPSLSPDGKSVLFINHEGHSRLALVSVGAGEARALLEENDTEYQSVEWLPDGKRILITARKGHSASSSYLYDLSRGSSRQVAPEGLSLRQANRHEVHVSPDGNSVLIRFGEEMFLVSLLSPNRRPLAGIRSSDSVIGWSNDGKQLYLHEQGGPKIYRVDLGTGRKQLWRDLTPPDGAGVVQGTYTICMSADVESYAYSFQRDLVDLYLVNGLYL